MSRETTKPCTCRDCGQPVPVPRPRNRVRCQVCSDVRAAERKRRYYDANRQAAINRALAWKRANAERNRQLSRESYARRAVPHRVATERWRAQNPGRVRDMRENRRARERAAFVEKVDRRVVWEARDGTCGICAEPVALEVMHLDHIVPLSRGGLHCYANTQPAHETCNKRKHNRMPQEAETA